MSNSRLIAGTLQTIVLNLLDDNGEMYGYEITQKVKELTQGEMVLTEGALYPTLHKLEANGMLKVQVKSVENRSRKYYQLTKRGVEEKQILSTEITKFIESIQAIITTKTATI